MTVAITGATGFVGQAVLDAAAWQNMPVNALTRRAQPAREGVRWVAGDLADRGALAELMTDADAVIHIAALTNAPRVEDFRKANVDGTAAVLEAAQAAGVDRVVFVSSLSAREPGLSQYGRSKADAEALFDKSTDWTIVRPPAVYGPRDRDMLDLFRAAKFGVVPVPPRGHASILHVEDLAELLLALAPGGWGITQAVFEPDDGRCGGYEHATLARLIGRAVGRKVVAPHLPGAVLRLAAGLDRLWRGDAARLTPDRVGYMVHPDWVADPARAVPATVWTARVPGEEGLALTADWYRREGWL